MNEYIVQEVELDNILNDIDFNCRGRIMPMDVVDLAKDIEKNGLQFPIAVQPITDTEVETTCSYRIVAGHRRFMACRVLKRTTIPVMIKSGLTELQARLVNLGENLKRKDLNILQEATAVARLRDLGLVQEAIAAELGMSRAWVQVRLYLLKLPEAIQMEASAGMLNQYQIRQLYELPTNGERFEAVKKIKQARLNGERSVDVGKKAKDDPFKKKRRTPAAIQDMMDHMGKTIGYGLYTRTLAWAAGNINSAELYYDIKRMADDLDIEYEVPPTVKV